MRKVQMKISVLLLTLLVGFSSLCSIDHKLEIRAAGEIAEMRATVAFSTETPLSGDNFFMELRINSASLGSLSGLIENLHIEFDLPSKLAIVLAPHSPTNDYTVTISGSHVSIDYNIAVPLGAQQYLRFVLAWNAGTTVEGVHAWTNPVITVSAKNCISAVALATDGSSPAGSVNPKNITAISYMTTEYQDIYAALLHTATVELKNEQFSGGLNLHNGKLTLDYDAAVYVAAIKLNGTIVPYTLLANTPGTGRVSYVVDFADALFKVDKYLAKENHIEIIYNYPARTSIGEDSYDLNINFTATREDGTAISETAVIQEKVAYRSDGGPAKDLFNKTALPKFTKVAANNLSWIITFTPLIDVRNVVIIEDPSLMEADFFAGFRLDRVEVSAFDPLVDRPTTSKVRTKIFYEHSGDLGNWYAVSSSEITSGSNIYSWSGSGLSATDLGLGSGEYVTRLKFEFYAIDGIATEIAELSGIVQVRLYAKSTSGITTTISNSFVDDNTITNTITAYGSMGKAPGGIAFDDSDVKITADTELNLNRPKLFWTWQPDDWFFANGATDYSGWSVEAHTGDWAAVNSAGGGKGAVAINDDAWIVERFLIEGGFFHDPILYFYIPDPNIKVLDIATGSSLQAYDIELYQVDTGGTIVKFRVRNALNFVPGNPDVSYPTADWDNYLPAFGPGDPGGYGFGWGHFWPRHDELAIKIKFSPGAQNSDVYGNIQLFVTSGDINQLASSVLVTDDFLVINDVAFVGQPFLSSRGFSYVINFSDGLITTSSVSLDNLNYQQILTLNNSVNPVDVFLKMSIENPPADSYGNLSRIRMIDMLPNTGDTMTVNSATKASTDPLTDYIVVGAIYNGTLLSFAELAAEGISVYYSSTATHISNRSELCDVSASKASHWTLVTADTVGTIPNSAKAIMVEKEGFYVGDILELVLKAVAPASVSTNRYWHSVAGGGRIGTTNLVPGEGLKSGFTGLGENLTTISGRVWNDLNKNGIQETGEPGYPGIAMRLYDATETEVALMLTAADGSYLFNGDFAPSSSWSIKFDLPPDYRLTVYRSAAATPMTDSDFSLYMGQAVVYFMFDSTATALTNLDAGIYDDREVYYTVIYDPGTQGTWLAVSQTRVGFRLGDPTPIFSGNLSTDHNPGYVFAGWRDGTNFYPNTAALPPTVTKDVTYVAQWATAPKTGDQINVTNIVIMWFALATLVTALSLRKKSDYSCR